MVYAPQRRHAVACIATTLQTLTLYQHLLAPNLLILLARVLAQLQISAAPLLHPQRSLLVLSGMLLLVNVGAGALHLLDFVTEGGKGVVLDFVGQVRRPSLTRVLLLDLVIFTLQLTSLTISYTTHHKASLPSTPSLPFDDLLLPPPASTPAASARSKGDDDGGDLESGMYRRKRKLGKGKGRAGEEEGEDEEETEGDSVWLDEDGDLDSSPTSHLLSGSSFSATTTRRKRPSTPHIFDLSLPHLLTLIFRLPAPTPPPPAFAGGTPMMSPAREDAPDLAAGGEHASAPPDVDHSAEPEPEQAGTAERVGRIPGDYWTAGRGRRSEEG